MPVTVRLIVGPLLILAGILLVVTAVLGARSLLPRNRWIGVRTETTLSSEERFLTGNRAAAAPLAAAGVVAIVGGAVLLAGPAAALGWVVVVVTVLGMLGLAGLAGVVGDRAAAAVPEPASFAASCAGTCAGCDLVAGCMIAPTGTSEPSEGRRGSARRDHQPQEPGPPLNGPTTSWVIHPP